MFIFEFWIIVAALFILVAYPIYRKKKKDQERLEALLEARLNQAGINDVDQMSGIEFEDYLAFLLKKLGYQIKRTPASNDFGADLILDGNERIVVQAKRYKNKVGIKAVQEINSARDYYNAREAWVITNNFFTLPAEKLADSSNIELIDRYELVDLILRAKNISIDQSN